MAAGASSPELFSSIVSLFITHSSLGLGTVRRTKWLHVATRQPRSLYMLLPFRLLVLKFSTSSSFVPVPSMLVSSLFELLFKAD